MYKNRLVYTSLLFSNDNALQTHWKSCCNSGDWQSVNDQILTMTDTQESITRHDFTQSIPKFIMEKIEEIEKKNNDKDPDKNDDNGYGNGKLKNKQNDDQKPVYNNNKNQKCWRLQDGREYSRIFFPFQKSCSKTKEGKQMCMKFLIWGFCDANCTHAHKLTTKDEAGFDKFYHKCREEKEGSTKTDFLFGAKIRFPQNQTLCPLIIHQNISRNQFSRLPLQQITHQIHQDRQSQFQKTYTYSKVCSFLLFLAN